MVQFYPKEVKVRNFLISNEGVSVLRKKPIYVQNFKSQDGSCHSLVQNQNPRNNSVLKNSVTIPFTPVLQTSQAHTLKT